MFPKWSDWHIQYTRKGLLKHRISQILKALTVLITIVAAYYIRKDIRGGLHALTTILRQNIKARLLSLLSLMQRGISSLPE